MKLDSNLWVSKYKSLLIIEMLPQIIKHDW